MKTLCRVIFVLALFGVLVWIIMSIFGGPPADNQQAKLIAERDQKIADREQTIAALESDLAKMQAESQGKTADITALEGQLSTVCSQLKKARGSSEKPNSHVLLEWSIDAPSFAENLESYITLNQESRRLAEEMQNKYRAIIVAKDAEIADLVEISNRQAKVKLPRFCLVAGVGGTYNPVTRKLDGGFQITFGIRIK